MNVYPLKTQVLGQYTYIALGQYTYIAIFPGYFCLGKYLVVKVLLKLFDLRDKMFFPSSKKYSCYFDLSSVEPSLNQLFCNQQSLWKDNNRVLSELLNIMRNRS